MTLALGMVNMELADVPNTFHLHHKKSLTTYQAMVATMMFSRNQKRESAQLSV